MTCESSDCSEMAVAAVYWPGKENPLRLCERCAARARNIGAAIGCLVAVEPLIILIDGSTRQPN